MRSADPVVTAVIIPARNEARRIPECLQALADQALDGVGVVVFANNCDDGTAALARDVGEAVGLNLEILDFALDPPAGVGTARRLGLAHAMRVWPGVAHLLTTDADCRVAQDWIARNRLHLSQVAAVCGRIEPLASERSVLEGVDVRSAAMEDRYEALVLEFYRRHRPGPLGLDGTHGGAPGASLGIRADAYRAVGGFADLAFGEDRDIVRRLKSAGFGVRHAGDVRVAASCRLDGRTGGGMAETLRARLEGKDHLVDDALPPARSLVAAAAMGGLGPWPLQVDARDRLRVSELAPNIALLESVLTAARPTPPPPVATSRFAFGSSF